MSTCAMVNCVMIIISLIHSTHFTNRASLGSKSAKAVSLDVDPVLRTICRSESGRKDVQRSTSKFLHYLWRDRDPELPVFGAERTAKEDLEFFNQSCSVFTTVEKE